MNDQLDYIALTQQMVSLMESIDKISLDITNLTNSINTIQKHQKSMLSNIGLILQLENQTQGKLASIFK